jgi:hypothetical protein
MKKRTIKFRTQSLLREKKGIDSSTTNQWDDGTVETKIEVTV